MDAPLQRQHEHFSGNPQDLEEFMKLADSPIRNPGREAALRAWEEYKLRRQLGREPGYQGKKGAYMRALIARVIDLRGANLDGICVGYADLRGVALDGCSLRGAWLKGVKLENATCRDADFSEIPGRGAARLLLSDLRGTDFTGANLAGVDLLGCVLSGATLERANLAGVNLERSTLISTTLGGSCITGARVYGISTWDLRGAPTEERDLIITPSDELEASPLTVDNLKVAQFVYLLLNNPEIRDVIDTVTTKTVLILGRFTAARKMALDALRNALRARNYVPLVFDFAPSRNRDLTETVQLLANMARFVVADLTEAKSLPQELSLIIPNLPSVPIQPIILESERPYAMFEHWERFRSVLPVFSYRDDQDLVASVAERILLPVATWTGQRDETGALKSEITALRAALASSKLEASNPSSGARN